jgi:hypothetical protein
MYKIIRWWDGKFHCECQLQDGTERWVEDDLEAAVTAVKRFARVMNGTKLKRKGIIFLQPKPVAELQLVPWNPYG